MPASSVLEAKAISTGAVLATGAAAAVGRFRTGSGACAEISCEDPSDDRVFWILSSAGSLFSRIAEEPGDSRAANSCLARCKVSIRSSAD